MATGNPGYGMEAHSKIHEPFDLKGVLSRRVAVPVARLGASALGAVGGTAINVVKAALDAAGVDPSCFDSGDWEAEARRVHAPTREAIAEATSGPHIRWPGPMRLFRGSGSVGSGQEREPLSNSDGAVVGGRGPGR